MTGDINQFFTIKSKEEGFVSFGDNKKGKIIGLGNIKISPSTFIENVLLVDKLKHNLLSDGAIQLPKPNRANRSWAITEDRWPNRRRPPAEARWPNQRQAATEARWPNQCQASVEARWPNQRQTAEQTPRQLPKPIKINISDGYQTTTTPLPTPAVTKTSLQRGTMAISPQRPLRHYPRRRLLNQPTEGHDSHYSTTPITPLLTTTVKGKGLQKGNETFVEGGSLSRHCSILLSVA